MSKFNKLDVPSQWRDEFTKYPHGYTIFEALCNWTKQVDNMVDNQNNWNVYLDNFVETFDVKLQEEVQLIIEKWQSEGLLDGIIESALTTELESVNMQLSECVNEISRIESNISTINSDKADKVIVDGLSNNKVDKNGVGQVTWGMIAQDAREQITGGNTAVVGDDSITTTNIVNGAVTKNKRTPSGSLAYVLGEAPINFDFINGMVVFPAKTDVFVNDVRMKVIDHPPVYFEFPPNANRYVLLFDVVSRVFQLRTYSENTPLNNENLLIVGSIRLSTQTAYLNGNFTVDGFPAFSDGGISGLLGRTEIFYRHRRPRIDGNKITFPAGIRIYYYGVSLGIYIGVIGPTEEELEFNWVHNTNIVCNFIDQTIKEVMYPDKIQYGEVVLFKNIDGKLVGGALKNQYEVDILNELNKGQGIAKGIGEIISTSTITGISAPNGAVVVGDEYWAFGASNDSHTDWGVCKVYDIDPDTLELTYKSEFQHNWGHVNSIDYREETDTFILGNGSGDYSLGGKIFIIPNGKAVKNNSQADINSLATIIDVSSEGWGAKTNVVWGDVNGGQHNIALVLTNDNKNIRKLLLHRTDGNFNGNYTLLDSYSQSDGGDVIQGAFYGNDGYLYVGLGHSGLWYVKQTLNADGTIGKETTKSIIYNEDGSQSGEFMESVSQYKDYILVRTVGAGDKVYFIKK